VPIGVEHGDQVARALHHCAVQRLALAELGLHASQLGDVLHLRDEVERHPVVAAHRRDAHIAPRDLAVRTDEPLCGHDGVLQACGHLVDVLRGVREIVGMEDVVHRATGEVSRLVADHARERRVDPDQVARGVREQRPHRSVVERASEEALALLERDLRRPLLADVAREREHARRLAVPDDRSRAHLNGNAPSGLRRQLRLVDGRRDRWAMRLRGWDEELEVRPDQLAAREAERSLDGGVRVDQPGRRHRR